MKANRLVFTLLLLSRVAVFQLAAHQTETDKKPLEEVKAKAEAGDADSQVQLGLRYDKGEGVPRDLVEAVKWYRKAAAQNYAKAQYKLGACYVKGEGVAKDQVEAAKWFRKAAEQNLAEAQSNLAACFGRGEGVAKDQVEAYKWLLLAASQGDGDAKKTMTMLETKITPEQIAEGQKRAHDFKPR